MSLITSIHTLPFLTAAFHLITSDDDRTLVISTSELYRYGMVMLQVHQSFSLTIADLGLHGKSELFHLLRQLLYFAFCSGQQLWITLHNIIFGGQDCHPHAWQLTAMLLFSPKARAVWWHTSRREILQDLAACAMHVTLARRMRSVKPHHRQVAVD